MSEKLVNGRAAKASSFFVASVSVSSTAGGKVGDEWRRADG